MAWWDDAYDAACDAVEAVGDVVEDVVETVGDMVADIIETAGNAAQDGLNPFAHLTGIGWLGGIIAGVTNFVGAVIKGVFGIVGGVLGGLITVIGGILLWNSDLIVEGVTDIWSSIAGAVILILGTFLSLVQRLTFLQNNDRSLTKAERALLRRVFLNSVSLYNVRIIEGWCGVFGINSQAFTLGNTIYMKSNDPSVVPDILVHECAHVWQYQNEGSRYTMDALGAQATYGGAEYNWEAEPGRGRSEWSDFNKEAQASMIQDIWTDGSLISPGHRADGNGAFYGLQGNSGDTVEFIFNGTNHTDLAVRAVDSLRGRINLRWSHTF